MRRKSMVKTKIAFVDDEYVVLSILGDRTLLEYRIEGKNNKEVYGIRKGRFKYREILNYLLNKYGYVFEVI